MCNFLVSGWGKLIGVTCLGVIFFVRVNSLTAQDRETIPSFGVTASESYYSSLVYTEALLQRNLKHAQLSLRDSIAHAASLRANQWIKELQKSRIGGLQLDHVGQLYIVADQDLLAIQQFNERLSTSGMSVVDRAYTLALAIKTFSELDDLERIAPAARYMAMLDSLPNEAVVYRFSAHLELAQAFYIARDIVSATRHFKKAISLVSDIPFANRSLVYFSPWFIQFADAVAHEEGGRATIDSVAHDLMRLAQPDSMLVSIDSAYHRLGMGYSTGFRNHLQITKYLGYPLPSLVATHWLNVPAPDKVYSDTAVPLARMFELGTGDVTLLGVCRWKIAGCSLVPGFLERIRNDFSDLTVWFATSTSGYWGSTPRTPEQEAQHLTHLFLKREHYGMNVALWAGPKRVNRWGGATPMRSPLESEVGTSEPIFIIVDNDGVVRHIVDGHISRRVELLIRRQLQHLVSLENFK